MDTTHLDGTLDEVLDELIVDVPAAEADCAGVQPTTPDAETHIARLMRQRAEERVAAEQAVQAVRARWAGRGRQGAAETPATRKKPKAKPTKKPHKAEPPGQAPSLFAKLLAEQQRGDVSGRLVPQANRADHRGHPRQGGE